MEILISAHEARLSQLELINTMPSYPTEDLLWDDDIIPSDEYNGEHCLALPKLNLQFLTFYDYLLRNYDLFRLESSYEIRGDIETAIKRIQPRRTDTNEIVYGGWSRYSIKVKYIKYLDINIV